MQGSFMEGDRVRAIVYVGGHYIKDVLGTIAIVDGDEIGVAFDDDIGGHDLNGMCNDGHGWWLLAAGIEHVCENIPEFKPASISDLLLLIGA